MPESLTSGIGPWYALSEEHGSDYNYHWHRGDLNDEDKDFMSIYAEQKYSRFWWVEIYRPSSPEDEKDVIRTNHDDGIEAAERVIELMTKYDGKE